MRHILTSLACEAFLPPEIVLKLKLSTVTSDSLPYLPVAPAEIRSTPQLLTPRTRNSPVVNVENFTTRSAQTERKLQQTGRETHGTAKTVSSPPIHTQPYQITELLPWTLLPKSLNPKKTFSISSWPTLLSPRTNCSLAIS